MKVIVLDDYQGVAMSAADWAPVTATAEVEVIGHHIADEAELALRLSDADVVVAMRERTPFGRDLLQRLPRLRLLVTTGPFNAAIDLAAAHDQGVTVCGTGGFIEPTVELTWALILGLLRHLPEEASSVRTGGWQTSVGGDLKGRQLGVVGLGRIGSRVARVGLAFGMSVVAWSQNLATDRAERVGARPVTKAELFEDSDVVTVHLVLSDRSRGTVGAPELRAMKPEAVLVNTSRGPLVDEAALIAALSSGAIAGAALDVFDTEPLPRGHPLRSMPNVLATPHLGYVSKKTYEVFFHDIVEDIVAFAQGSPIRTITPKEEP
jgi:phosphoglycerate dehydrogenase-like enzyme